MALRFSLEEITDWEAISPHRDDGGLYANGEEGAITEAVIFLMTTLGASGITSDNLAELMFRVRVMETVAGPSFRQYNDDTERWDPTPIQAEWLVRRVGLSVNVTPESTDEFLHNMLTPLRQRAEWDIEQLVED